MVIKEWYIPQNITKENSLLSLIEKDRVIIYFPSVCFLVMVTFIIIFAFKNRKNNKLKEVNIVENYETVKLNK